LHNTGVEERAVTILAKLKGYGFIEKQMKLIDVRLHPPKPRTVSDAAVVGSTASSLENVAPWGTMALRSAFTVSCRITMPHHTYSLL
jgi:hypothetical protein